MSDEEANQYINLNTAPTYNHSFSQMQPQVKNKIIPMQADEIPPQQTESDHAWTLLSN